MPETFTQVHTFCGLVGHYWHFIVYQMGRLCGGTHEISGIKVLIVLHGWVGVVGWVMGWR